LHWMSDTGRSSKHIMAVVGIFGEIFHFDSDMQQRVRLDITVLQVDLGFTYLC
jgi:hypothetical protein